MRNEPRLHKKKNGNSHSLKGFSLVELLVVIFIISLVVGITMPKLGRSSMGARLKSTTASVTGLLETAKSFATTQHTYCQAIFDGATGKIFLEKKDVDDADNDADTDEMIQCEKGIKIPVGIAVYFTADNVVIFNPWGGVDSPDDAITIGAASINKQRTITVDQVTGYVKVT